MQKENDMEVKEASESDIKVQIDKKGGIAIPEEVLEYFNLKPGDQVQIVPSKEQNSLILRIRE